MPGVFDGNIYPGAVNGSLWTLPYEISMYKWVAFLGLISIIRRPFVFNLLYLAWCLICFFVPPTILVHQVQMRLLSFAFFSGAFLYVNRQRIPLNGFIALGLCAAAMLCHRTGSYQLMVEAALAYGAIWLAYRPSGFIRRYNSLGDYSYGMYIYAFPVQQSLAAIAPHIRPIPLFLIAFALTSLIASLSWHIIEKRALNLKGKLAGPVWRMSRRCLLGFRRSQARTAS